MLWGEIMCHSSYSQGNLCDLSTACTPNLHDAQLQPITSSKTIVGHLTGQGVLNERVGDKEEG